MAYFEMDSPLRTADSTTAFFPERRRGHTVEGERYRAGPPPYEEPPEFTPYDQPSGNFPNVFYDPQLNQDGEALHRFLLDQAKTPPIFRIGIQGTHEMMITNEDHHSRMEITTEFRFYLEPSLLREMPALYVVGDRNVAFRGGTVKEIDAAETTGKDPEGGAGGSGSQLRRQASKLEQRCAADRAALLASHGLPPWALLRGDVQGTQASIDSEKDRHRFNSSARRPAGVQYNDSTTMQSPSQSLRRWTDLFCTSNQSLKSFTLDKVVYGWDLELLRGKIEETVQDHWSTKGLSNPRVTVWFDIAQNSITVRPLDWLQKWMKVLLCMVLVYPFVMLARRSQRGEWRVAGAAYALARWVHLDDSTPGERIEEYRNRIRVSRGTTLKRTPRGVSRLVGPKEEAWFKEWEGTIIDYTRRLVKMRPYPKDVDRR
ncbi:hypothetical protein FRB96_002993 [Tulasnella sp. 330]|nr:hypothetical protein FRB96_002993 [Tulasnella sp. 330]KAG8874020.1 hypothetical protein FRB97_006201 [Tulasnella sp. 331]KAG8887066.1 hypothetical protein FRB98_000593 [Tulasnella sp. 332]